MKPEILWLFGDSFVDPIYNPTNDFLVYHKRLEQDFIVKNFAMVGTGPEWSLQKFIEEDKQTDNDLKQKIGIVFVASYYTRFNFKFFNNDPSHQNWLVLGPADKKNCPHRNLSIKIDPFFKEFCLHYLYNNVTDETFLLSNMLLVNHFAMHYNKCIYLSTSDFLFNEEIRKTYNVKNFYVPDFSLGSLHIHSRLGKFPNHMDEFGHKKVYNLLSSILMH